MSYAPGILSTKRAAPKLPQLFVGRERLRSALDACVAEQSITLICGPGGAGKTCVAAAWAEHYAGPEPIAWLRLSDADDSRVAFWRQVVFAIAGTGASEALTGLAVPSPIAIDDLLVDLFSALDDLDEPVVLILDDIHEISDPQVLGDLGAVLRSPPEGLKLVVVGHAATRLHVARLRLAGELGEITGNDLRYTLEEASQFLAVTGLALSEADQQKVWEVAEGWAAGLALCALALQSSPDVSATVDRLSGGIDLISEYLLEEVFTTLIPGAREFLLYTSILDVTCGDLADAITDESDGATTLHELRSRGALIESIDIESVWYRYHGLLRGMLLSRLHRDHAELVPALHQRAARWLADNDMPIPAVRHAIAAEDVSLAGEIVTTHAFALQMTGELAELAEAIRLLPTRDLRSHSIFAVTLAGAAAEVGDLPEAVRWQEIAAAATADGDDVAVDPARTAIGLYVARLTGDVPSALRSIGAVDAGSDATGEIADTRALALVNVGAMEAWLGNGESAIARLDEGMETATERGRDYLHLYGLVHRAVAHIWVGDIRTAGDDATRAMAIADAHGWRRTNRGATALVVLSVQALLQARLSDAALLLDDATRAMPRAAEVPLQIMAALTHARITRARGAQAEAAELLRLLREEFGRSPFFDPVADRVFTEEAVVLAATDSEVHARDMLDMAVARDRSRLAAVELGRMLLSDDPARSLSLASDPDLGHIDTLVAAVDLSAQLVIARAEELLSRPQKAWAALEDALRFVDESGIRLPVLELGVELVPLLQAHCTTNSIYSALSGDLASTLLLGEADQTNDAVEELSLRELTVLRYLPSRMSNRDIGNELMVSVNTVKTHVKHIYLKLGACDRRDAVLRARRAGLIGGSLGSGNRPQTVQSAPTPRQPA